jgi:hypothetical protein
MHESASQQIQRGIISRYPLIYIHGWEEERIEKTLAAVSSSTALSRSLIYTTLLKLLNISVNLISLPSIY